MRALPLFHEHERAPAGVRRAGGLEAFRTAVVAVLPALVALGVEWTLWPYVQPSAWFAFFPAVFVSGWLGGRWTGAASALVSSGLIVAAFEPPERSTAWLLVPAVVLTITGALVGIVRDRLRSAGAQLSSFLDLAPDGIFVADLDGRYTDVNEAGCRMLGYLRQELIGKAILDLVPPEDVERLRRSKEQLIEGRIHVAEWSLRCKDGAYLPVEVSARILPDGRWQGFVRDVRERRRVELALHRSEDDLRRAQAVARVGSWRLDVRRNELRWSDEAHRIFGVPQGAPLTYETFLGCVHPDDREQVDRRWKAALRGEPYDVDHRVVAGGVVKWVRERADLERDERGTLVGGIGTTQDITEHKRAEAALRLAHETEQRLRGELEAVSRADAAIAEAVAGLTGPDLATVLNMIALQARALTGARYVALGVQTDPGAPFAPWISLGMPEAALSALGGRPRPVGTLGLVSREGRTLRVDDVREHPAFAGFPAGHPELASLLGVPILYRGRPVGNLYLANAPGGAAFSEDDERRVRLLAERTGVAIETATLFAGESGRRAWLQSVVEQMPDAVVVVDRDGQPLMHNRAAAALFPDGTPLSRELRDPAGAKVPRERRPLLLALGEGASVVRAEHIVVGLEGQRIPVLISATPVRVGQEVIGAVEVLQDIREQKELERQREEWTSIVAHDLRSPVGTIRLSVDRLLSLREGQHDEKERGHLTRIKGCAVRLGRMIDDLLEASRVEAERLSLQPRMADVGVIVERSAEQPSTEPRGQRVEVSAPPGATAWVDPDRLQQVLENLLSNAAKYGRPGSEIRVEVSARDEEVEVAVTNEGPGIPPAELPILFSRFARTRDARAGSAPGLGLGLYISHGIVRAHGGRMWAESVPDRTTTIRFTLPRRPP